MSTETLAPPAASRRASDAAAVVVGAIASTGAIVGLHRSPLAAFAALAVVLAAFCARFHERRDWAGLAVGATFGNATELVSDLGGVWVHAERPLLGVAPPYIFLCYPILGLTIPRLVAAVAPNEPLPRRDPRAPLAVVPWVALVALSYRFGRENGPQLAVSAGVLLATLALFHAPRDLVAGGLGALLASTWELPCTAFGVWSFPAPQVAGLIPLWLPVAYAAFFILLMRLAHHAAELTPQPPRPTLRP